MKKLIVAAITIALIVLIAFGINAQTHSATCRWSPPTYGTPVEHYVIELNTDNAGWVQAGVTPDTFMVFNDFAYGHTYMARVAGVDSLDRQGPWSLPTDPYTPDMGLPGVISKPWF